MAKIKVLDKQVAELIAAGEVIERPASVVKELMENSIDAGATQIQLEIRNGGIRYMRISDNGCGIAHDDVPKAFLRHATSKVEQEEDLNKISTLGFRGEALASVCAVASVEIMTKPAGHDFGTKYKIRAGEEIEYAVTGTSDGTTIIVTDLFATVPARLKFLKKDYAEANAVASIVDKIALSHPEIAIQFIKDHKMTLNTPGNNDLYSTIYAVFGRDFAQSLTKVQYSYRDIKVSGYVSIPMQSRANRSMQHFFVNGRYVKSRTCAIALEEAYKNAIMVGKFPACVLKTEMPPHTVDVNVHPAKIEVRFVQEKLVFEAVYCAVQSALGAFEASKLTDKKQSSSKKADIAADLAGFKHEERQQIPLIQSNTAAMKLDNGHSIPAVSEKVDIPMELEEKSEFQFIKSNSLEPVKSTRIICEEDAEFVKEPSVEKIAEADTEQAENAHIYVIGEVFKTYLLAQAGEKFIIIDKHAAHERILFEKLKENAGALDKQLLLSSYTVTLSREEYQSVLENMKLIDQLGYTVEDFGNGSVIIREIPMLLEHADSKSAFLEIADNLAKNKRYISPEFMDSLYSSMACKAAIKANDRNDIIELEELANQVYWNDDVRYCPHGRPVIISFNKNEIEKMFGRIV